MHESAEIGQTRIVETPDGRTLGVCVWGDVDGAPMFLLHGTPGSRFVRDPGDGYRRNDLRVYTYDRPGYGLSTRVPGVRVADAAGDVRVIADALGLERFGVVGVSGGGPSALAVAALLPTRVSRCATVVGLAPFTAEGLDFYAGMDEQGQAEWKRIVQGGAALEVEAKEMTDWVEAGLPGVEVPDDVRAMLLQSMQEAIRQGPEGYLDDYLALAQSWGVSVENVRVPTRVLVARDDTSVPPAHGEWLARHIPDAKLIWVNGGHFGPRDAEELQLMSWVGHGTP